MAGASHALPSDGGADWGEVRGRLPLELKTGRPGAGNIAHRAQVALYALLMADRKFHAANVTGEGRHRRSGE